jgi:Arylsulfotransferase (ASST)
VERGIGSTDRNVEVDWTHANALTYFEEEEAILVSFRNQSWIVKIDHTSGEIIWILGDQTDTSSEFADSVNFISLLSGEWMTYQHGEMVTENGDILVYDNRNGSGGDENNSRAERIDWSSFLQ